MEGRKGGEKDMITEREKMKASTVSEKISVNTKMILGAGMTLQSCPNVGQGTFSPTFISYWIQVMLKRVCNL